MKKTFTLIISLLMLGACIKEDPIKQPYEGFSPDTAATDWLVSTPAAENMDAQGLEDAYRLVYKSNRYVLATSLLVARHGKLVAEVYPRDKTDEGRIQNLQSITKSFSSIMTGIALSEGLIDSLNIRLSDIYPEHFTNFPDKINITLRNALCMKTGLEYDNSHDTEPLYHCDGSSVEFVLSKEKLYEPGIVMHYNDGAPQLVSAAIQKKAGMTLEDYAKNNLFNPIGIYDVMWEKGNDGVTFGAFSLFLKPRDFAKIGQLLLQNGRWGNRQVIDSSWIALATTIQSTGNFNGMPYGLYFWILPAYNGYMMEGHGGQFLAIFPDKQLVIAYTAWPYTSDKFFDEFPELIDLIYNSCR